MSRRFYSSVAERTSLAGAVDASTTTLIVNAVAGWPTNTPYTLLLDTDTINEEIVEVVNRSGTTLTVNRGVDGSTGKAHDAGADVRHGVSGRDFNEPNLHVNTPVQHITVVTSSTRPSVPVNGQVIFESDTGLYFGWDGSRWGAIGGGATGGGSDRVFFENDVVVTENYTITSSANAGSFGPVTIDDGVTVTIPSGSVWTVV
jgi:hypothetical protein